MTNIRIPKSWSKETKWWKPMSIVRDLDDKARNDRIIGKKKGCSHRWKIDSKGEWEEFNFLRHNKLRSIKRTCYKCGKKSTKNEWGDE